MTSIIVPVYNVQKYLSKCIESILAQTEINFELILINDGSTDLSRQICQYYANLDNRIQVFNQENRGVSSARNLGIEVSNGKWIMFMDADDWIESQTLEKVITLAEKNDSEIVLFDYYLDYSKKSLPCSFLDNFSFDSEKDRVNFLTKILYSKGIRIGISCAKLYLATLIKPNFRFDVNISLSEDICFNLSVCLTAKRINYLHESLYHYRQHSMSQV